MPLVTIANEKCAGRALNRHDCLHVAKKVTAEEKPARDPVNDVQSLTHASPALARTIRTDLVRCHARRSPPSLPSLSEYVRSNLIENDMDGVHAALHVTLTGESFVVRLKIHDGVSHLDEFATCDVAARERLDFGRHGEHLCLVTSLLLRDDLRDLLLHEDFVRSELNEEILRVGGKSADVPEKIERLLAELSKHLLIFDRSYPEFSP